VLVAISKGMQAVKLRINKILQFLTGGAGERKLNKPFIGFWPS